MNLAINGLGVGCMWPVERGGREADFSTAPSTPPRLALLARSRSGFGRNDNGLGFAVWVLCRLSAVAWRVGIVAGLGEEAGSSSVFICIMRSTSRATALLGLAVLEISVRGARVPSSGSVVISSTVSGALVASR
jgi:hypothetical protein